MASKSRKQPNGESVELFLSLPQQQAHAIRQKLLEALSSESFNSVRNKIGDAVAEIARQYSDNGTSSELGRILRPLHYCLVLQTDLG
jgi:hypothetical protein